jgi:hypothetical protein
VYAWVSLSLTGATAIAAGITGGLALSAHGELKSALGTFPGNASTIGSDQSKTRTFAVATDVLGAVTLAGAAATTVLFVMGPKWANKPTAFVSPRGVAVVGSF